MTRIQKSPIDDSALSLSCSIRPEPVPTGGTRLRFAVRPPLPWLLAAGLAGLAWLWDASIDVSLGPDPVLTGLFLVAAAIFIALSVVRRRRLLTGLGGTVHLDRRTMRVTRERGARLLVPDSAVLPRGATLVVEPFLVACLRGPGAFRVRVVALPPGVSLPDTSAAIATSERPHGLPLPEGAVLLLIATNLALAESFAWSVARELGCRLVAPEASPHVTPAPLAEAAGIPFAGPLLALDPLLRLVARCLPGPADRLAGDAAVAASCQPTGPGRALLAVGLTTHSPKSRTRFLLLAGFSIGAIRSGLDRDFDMVVTWGVMALATVAFFRLRWILLARRLHAEAEVCRSTRTIRWRPGSLLGVAPELRLPEGGTVVVERLEVVDRRRGGDRFRVCVLWPGLPAPDLHRPAPGPTPGVTVVLTTCRAGLAEAVAEALARTTGLRLAAAAGQATEVPPLRAVAAAQRA